MLIDDRRYNNMNSVLGTQWQGVSDRVMGGISAETLRAIEYDGRPCLQLSGEVKLANNGGFIQMALDLDPQHGLLDASALSGVELMVSGNGESYSVHLRTADITRPWQSYRASFTAPSQWQSIRLPFAEFKPHQTEIALDLRRLRRLGLVAIGREFRAELRLARLALF